MNRRLLAATTGVLALGGFLAACGDDKMSKDDFVEEAQENAGWTEEQASCVFDELGDDAESFLGQEGEPSEEDLTRFTDAATKCIGAATDMTIPDMTMPDISMPDLSGITIPDIAGVTVPG